jgi:hypothetical protein
MWVNNGWGGRVGNFRLVIQYKGGGGAGRSAPFIALLGYCNIGLLHYRVTSISGYCNIGLLQYRVIAISGNCKITDSSGFCYIGLLHMHIGLFIRVHDCSDLCSSGY